jgi:hypothetical protein
VHVAIELGEPLGVVVFRIFSRRAAYRFDDSRGSAARSYTSGIGRSISFSRPWMTPLNGAQPQRSIIPIASKYVVGRAPPRRSRLTPCTPSSGGSVSASRTVGARSM